MMRTIPIYTHIYNAIHGENERGRATERGREIDEKQKGSEREQQNGNKRKACENAIAMQFIKIYYHTRNIPRVLQMHEKYY